MKIQKNLMLFVLGIQFYFFPLTVSANAICQKAFLDQVLYDAKIGDARAQINMAVRYHKGEGYPKDIKKAIYWYKKAIERGSKEAMFSLGMMHYLGTEMPQDNKKALSLIKQSAKKGDALAQMFLGHVYTVDANKKILPNYDQAIKWTERAAKKGLREAQNKLGLLYVIPANQDLVKAYAWLNLSLMNKKIPLIDEIRNKMTKDQLTSARQLLIQISEEIPRKDNF